MTPDMQALIADRRLWKFLFVTAVLCVLTGLVLVLTWLISRLVYPPRWRLPVRQFLMAGYVLFIMWSIRSIWINPLPSDEAYIANFEKHRVELERLVELYRNKTEVIALAQKKEYIKNRSFYRVPEVQQLMSHTGASHFHGEPKHAIGVELGAAFPGESQASLRYDFPAVLYKEFIHTLKPTIFYAPVRIVDSLNDYPPGYWPGGECVYRRLTPHWSLKVCRRYQ